MSPSIPTNFNDTAGFEQFAKDLGVRVGVGFLVPALVLSVALIVIFVKYCGGSGKTSLKFTPTERHALTAASAIICIICIATCAVGWSYNNNIHSGVTEGTATLSGVISTSMHLMQAVNTSVTDLKDDLFAGIAAKSVPVVDNITSLLVPLNNIIDVIELAGTTLRSLTDLTQDIVDNITIVKSDLASLDAVQAEQVITGVPSPNEIPNVDSSYTDSLNNSLSSLDGVIGNVNNMTNEVNDTLGAVNTTVTANLWQLTDNYDKNAEGVLSYVESFSKKISSTNRSFSDVSTDVTHYSQSRKSLMAALLVLPLALSALALAGVLFRLKLIIKISAALCFVFMFWYFLAAGINYIAYYTVDQVCQNEDVLVGSALSIASSDITIPGTNITVKVSEKIELLLRCTGNDTLIEIFEFNFLIDDLTGQMVDELQSLTRDTNQLNQTAQYQQSLRSLAAMQNTSVNLDFLQNTSLPTVHQELRNITQQINSTINNPAYASTIHDVNAITNNLVLNNGTEIHMYYDASNITSLNCTNDPYSKLSASQQTDLCNKSSYAIALTRIRNKTISRSGDVYGNVTDIDNRLAGFEASLPRILALQNKTREHAADIRTNLDDAYFEAAAIISYVQSVVRSIIGVIYGGTGAIVRDTQCAYLGDAYVKLSHNVCQNVRHSLKIITAMMLIGAAMLFASAVAGMMTVHKLTRSYGDQL